MAEVLGLKKKSKPCYDGPGSARGGVFCRRAGHLLSRASPIRPISSAHLPPPLFRRPLSYLPPTLSLPSLSTAHRVVTVAMTDYTKLKVTELRDLLTRRSLSTAGNKPDLIARLTSSNDASGTGSGAGTVAAPTPSASATASAAAKPSHLPSADDYEVDWGTGPDEEPVSAPAVVAPTVSAIAPSVTTASEKPKRKTIASLFDESSTAKDTASADTTTVNTGAATATTATKDKSPSSPSTVNGGDDAKPSAATLAESEKKPSFSANLPSTSLDTELERRKARAARFGASAADTEQIKLLERQKRFGVEAVAAESSNKPQVKGLDDALPERKRRGGAAEDGSGGRGKRGRFGGRGGGGGTGGRGGNRDRDRGNGNTRGNSNSGVQQQRRDTNQKKAAVIKKSVLDDPEERRKAEARAKKFGTAA